MNANCDRWKDHRLFMFDQYLSDQIVLFEFDKVLANHYHAIDEQRHYANQPDNFIEKAICTQKL